MATEEGESPSIPEEAAGVSEKIKDMEELSTLEDEKIRLIGLLTQFEEDPSGLASEFDRVRHACEAAGIPNLQLLSLQTAMTGASANARKAIDVVSRAFVIREQAKAAEVQTDEARQIAGEVRQGGMPVDVKPKPPKQPQGDEDEKAAEVVDLQRVRSAELVFDVFKKELTTNAIVQLRDDSEPMVSLAPGEDVDKWEHWNEWTTEQMVNQGLEPVEFDLKSVKPQKQPC